VRLAIDGGDPVRNEILPYGRHVIDEEDISAVEAVLRSDWLTTGPEIARFEQALAEATGSRHAVAVSSGTAALHAMFAAAGIGPGDEVIVPAITFAATANAVLYLGADPVFADVDHGSLLIDPADIQAKIGPHTKAVVPVDFAGQPADYDAIKNAITGYDCKILSDACHALGASYNGRNVGSVAEASTFSFHPVKHVAAGEGGAVTTDDPSLAEAMTLFRNHGITTDHRQRRNAGTWEYGMVQLGFNYRLSDIHAALAGSQLKRLPRNVERRQILAARYDTAFAGSDVVEPLETASNVSHAYHIYVIRLILDRLSVDRGQVFAALRAENIGVNVHYMPVPWHPYYRDLGYERGAWPAAESAYERMLTLPLYAGMTDEDQDQSIEAVDKVVSAYAI
jgi:perosamine synthetase